MSDERRAIGWFDRDDTVAVIASIRVYPTLVEGHVVYCPAALVERAGRRVRWMTHQPPELGGGLIAHGLLEDASSEEEAIRIAKKLCDNALRCEGRLA